LKSKESGAVNLAQWVAAVESCNGNDYCMDSSASCDIASSKSLNNILLANYNITKHQKPFAVVSFADINFQTVIRPLPNERVH